MKIKNGKGEKQSHGIYIQGFESSEDIIYYLREQWAGLFQRFLQEQRRLKEVNVLQGIENTANTLNQLINYLTEEKKDTELAIKDILISNHPAFDKLKKLLSIPYRVFFLTKDEMTAWLNARNYKAVAEDSWDEPNVEEWFNRRDNKQYLLKIVTDLFDENGNLKPVRKEDWNDGMIRLEVTDLQPTTTVDDLPF